MNGYLIIDVGTGNVRVAITTENGNILHVERDNVYYTPDENYPDALSFDPEQLWNQILVLIQSCKSIVNDIEIVAITASSQREGIVLLDKNGKALIGLPNHDHRGRQWQNDVKDTHEVYMLTGRYPSSLFSALKVIGIREGRAELYREISMMLSISDWVQYCLCGIAVYEHSQASETLLYDVAGKQWSEKLCNNFQLNRSMLPELKSSGTVLGPILPNLSKQLSISGDAIIVVGGADTQLAIKSTGASLDDVVIVSGTTTPITKLISEYITDDHYRTWTNRYADDEYMILETNAGVTGLNFQRLKNIFYPSETYEAMDLEIASSPRNVDASLGSLIGDEKKSMLRGGFIFNTPVAAELKRSSFMRAALWDAACCIRENYEILNEVSPHNKEFVWSCGGGFQSDTFRNFISTLINKPLKIRKGYHQASVTGGAFICSEAFNQKITLDEQVEIIYPVKGSYEQDFKKWKSVRKELQSAFGGTNK
jgi:autoinducer-2 kinase